MNLIGAIECNVTVMAVCRDDIERQAVMRGIFLLMLVHLSARGFLDAQSDLVFAAATADRGASAKDEMGH